MLSLFMRILWFVKKKHIKIKARCLYCDKTITFLVTPKPSFEDPAEEKLFWLYIDDMARWAILDHIVIEYCS